MNMNELTYIAFAAAKLHYKVNSCNEKRSNNNHALWILLTGFIIKAAI